MGFFYLYLAQGEKEGIVFLSPDPTFDFAYLQKVRGYESLDYLSSGLPAGIAARLLVGLRKKLRKGLLSKKENLSPQPEVLRIHLMREMRVLAYRSPRFSFKHFLTNPDLACISQQRTGCNGVLFPRNDELEEVERLLKGRLLKFREITRSLGLSSEAGMRHLVRILRVLCVSGRVSFLPAFIPLKGSLVRCQRCGWEGIPHVRACSACESDECCICPECVVMGGLSLCEALYTAREETCENVFCGNVSIGDCSRINWLKNKLGNFLHHDDLRAREENLWCPLVFFKAGKRSRNKQRETGKALKSGRHDLSEQETKQQVCLRFDVDFTPPQAAAVQTLLKFGEQGEEGRECLVWAVCGAGKTEVTFPVIGQALARGEKVLFATPRRDVVLEVAPRLVHAFGSRQVVALYGGSRNKNRDAPLVVATTHQTLRFHRAFDLVVFDEEDAFPYPGNRVLHFGVAQACRPGGKIIYLTATPERRLLERAKRGLVEMIKLPARPHGFPLPEPRFLKVQPLRRTPQGDFVDKIVLALVNEAVKKYRAQMFIFVPIVELTGVVGRALRAAVGKPPLENFYPEWIEWSHAGDQDRFLKRERFFAGEFFIFVTITIMERGVTVPRIHILVFWADQAAVFETSTLVQIAGRCGRSPTYPGGEVWFVAPRVSREMQEALAQIKVFNAEAFAGGYLRPDYPDVLEEMLKVQGTDGLRKQHC